MASTNSKAEESFDVVEAIRTTNSFRASRAKSKLLGAKT